MSKIIIYAGTIKDEACEGVKDAKLFHSTSAHTRS